MVTSDDLFGNGTWGETNCCTMSVRKDTVRVYVTARNEEDPIHFAAHCTIPDAEKFGVPFSGEVHLEAKTLVEAMQEVDRRWPQTEVGTRLLRELERLREAQQSYRAQRREHLADLEGFDESLERIDARIGTVEAQLRERGDAVPEAAERPAEYAATRSARRILQAYAQEHGLSNDDLVTLLLNFVESDVAYFVPAPDGSGEDQTNLEQSLRWYLEGLAGAPVRVSEYAEIRYVLHSPYPDKTWRGWEKCMGAGVAPHVPGQEQPASGVLLFDTAEEAERARQQDAETAEFWMVWPIQLGIPAVRTARPEFSVEQCWNSECPSGASEYPHPLTPACDAEDE